MTDSNLNQYGAQTTCLCNMVGKCSFDSQHGGPDWHPANLGCSKFKYKNKDQSKIQLRDNKGKNGCEKTKI